MKLPSPRIDTGEYVEPYTTVQKNTSLYGHPYSTQRSSNPSVRFASRMNPNAVLFSVEPAYAIVHPGPRIWSATETALSRFTGGGTTAETTASTMRRLPIQTAVKT